MNYNKKTWGENDYFTNQDANEMSEAIADLSKSSGVEYVSVNVDDAFNNGENLLTAEDIEKIQRGAFIKLYSYSSNNNDGGGDIVMAKSTRGVEEETSLFFIGTCLPSGNDLNGIEYSSNMTHNNNSSGFGFFTLTIRITSETESLVLIEWVGVNTFSSGGAVAV